MKKRIISILLAVITIASALPVKVTAASYEHAWFPAPVMNLTQLAYESCSHGNCNAIDILPGGNVFAPFTGKIVYADSNWGYVLLQSTDKVYYANGKLDYMTVAFMHDWDISDLYVGRIINQGTNFYQAGAAGASAVHVDISVYSGKVNTPPSGYGKGDTYAYDAFFINAQKTTEFYNKGVMEQGNYITNGGYSDWRNLWKMLPTCSHKYQGTGKCSKCGEYFNWQATESTSSIGYYTVTKSDGLYPRLDSPYDDAKKDAKKLSKGTTVKVLASYKNAYNNTWYKITYNNGASTGYVYSDWLKFSKKLESTLSINITWPYENQTIPRSAHNLMGTISSNYAIKKADAYLDGKYMGSDSPNKMTFSLIRSKMDYALPFDTLQSGRHVLKISGQSQILWDLGFRT